MTYPIVAGVAADSVIALMLGSVVLAFIVHVIRRDLDPIEKPFSAYLSVPSRQIGLACYACLVAGVAAFVLASVTRRPLDVGMCVVSVLYVTGIVFLAVAAATARSDIALAPLDPRTRWRHRWSAFVAFSFVISAIVMQTWLWQRQDFVASIRLPLMALAGLLVALFALLSFVAASKKGAVQKLLMFCIVVWFVTVAATMRR